MMIERDSDPVVGIKIGEIVIRLELKSFNHRR